MKNLAAIVPSITPGAVKQNTKAIIEAVVEAQSKGVELALLPNNVLTGSIGDMSRFITIQRAIKKALRTILKSIKIPIILGSYLLDNHKIQYNKKGFYTLRDGTKISIPNQKLLSSPGFSEPLEVDIIAIPSSYPAYMGGLARKKAAAAAISHVHGCTVIIACSGEGDTTFRYVRSGDKIIAHKGEILAASTGDQTTLVTANISKWTNPPIDLQELINDSTHPLRLDPTPEECDEVFDIIARGIYGRMQETKQKKLIIGVSGGLDSSFILLAAKKTFEKYKLDSGDILAVTLQAEASSERTYNNAKTLISELNVSWLDYPITTAVSLHLSSIDHTHQDITYENAQARYRTLTLLNLANKYGALMLGTGDLFESALGFSTFGGDQLAHYCPASSLTKTAIRTMIKEYIKTLSLKRKSLVDCLTDILNTPVSPELKKNQTTEKLLGPIELHEFFLARLLCRQESGKQILSAAKEEFDLSPYEIKKYYKQFITRFFNNRFKLEFASDGIQLTPFDPIALRIPLNFSPELWL